MNDVNSVWVRGRKNRDEMVEALLDSGYQLRVDLDSESESLGGIASYLISFVQPRYSGVRFEAVDEDDNLVEYEQL